MKKVALILSGCGHSDGSEIREAVFTMLEIDKHSLHYDVFAPNIPQTSVVNHRTGEEVGEKRNVLVESARIARGRIDNTNKLNVDDYDAVFLPGGFGIAKNLSDIASEGPYGSVISEVQEIIPRFVNAGKPIGAICFAPAVVAKTLSNVDITGVLMTMGSMEDGQLLEKMGMRSEECNVEDFVVDLEFKVYTTPAYMIPGGAYCSGP